MINIRGGLLILIFNLVHYVCGDCPPDREKVEHYEAKLHKDLFCAYDYHYRPVKDHKSAVNVSIRFSLRYISFDASDETINVHNWLTMRWKDEFLAWDPKDYGNITELQVESYKLWTPRLTLHNADVAIYQSDTIYTTCLLKNTGVVFCNPHISHSGLCQTSLTYWPYGYQNCTLYFGSWMHTGEQVNFQFSNSSPVLKDNYEDGPGWKLIEVYNDRLLEYINPMLKYTFVLKRISAGIAAILIVPTLLTVILTVASWLVDVKDNKRLALQCFALYGHFMLITRIGYTIPKHTASTPLLILFTRDSIIMTLVSILATLLLKWLRSRMQQMPPWLEAFNTLVMTGRWRYVVFTEFDDNDAENTRNLFGNGSGVSQAGGAWINLTNILNSIAFIILVTAYFILLLVYLPRDTIA